MLLGLVLLRRRLLLLLLLLRILLDNLKLLTHMNRYLKSLLLYILGLAGLLIVADNQILHLRELRQLYFFLFVNL